MSHGRTSGSEIIRAAGGLLWRRGRRGYEIAVIRRERYQDWTLPKGKLDPGETWEVAAVREVREETGFKAKLLGFAGAVSYATLKGPKVVRYWHMEPVGKPGALEKEVAEVVWMTIEDARKQMDYDLERAILEAWEGPGKASKA